jgi:hypothetical protein
MSTPNPQLAKILRERQRIVDGLVGADDQPEPAVARAVAEVRTPVDCEAVSSASVERISVNVKTVTNTTAIVTLSVRAVLAESVEASDKPSTGALTAKKITVPICRVEHYSAGIFSFLSSWAPVTGGPPSAIAGFESLPPLGVTVTDLSDFGPGLRGVTLSCGEQQAVAAPVDAPPSSGGGLFDWMFGGSTAPQPQSAAAVAASSKAAPGDAATPRVYYAGLGPGVFMLPPLPRLPPATPQLLPPHGRAGAHVAAGSSPAASAMASIAAAAAARVKAKSVDAALTSPDAGVPAVAAPAVPLPAALPAATATPAPHPMQPPPASAAAAPVPSPEALPTATVTAGKGGPRSVLRSAAFVARGLTPTWGYYFRVVPGVLTLTATPPPATDPAAAATAAAAAPTPALAASDAAPPPPPPPLPAAAAAAVTASEAPPPVPAPFITASAALLAAGSAPRSNQWTLSHSVAWGEPSASTSQCVYALSDAQHVEQAQLAEVTTPCPLEQSLSTHPWYPYPLPAAPCCRSSLQTCAAP